MRTLAVLIVLSLPLAVLVGCSRGKGEPAQPQTQPTSPTPSTSAAKTVVKELPPEPEPEPEPAPGEIVKLAMPKEGGVWPWLVGTNIDSTESRPIWFTGSGPYAANGFAVRPALSRAVVTMRVDPYANPKKGFDPRKATDATRVTLYDTAAGIALTEWAVPGSFTILDLSPDGRSILATSSRAGHGRGSLRLWVIGSDGQLKRWTALAHTTQRDGQRSDSLVAAGTEIRWAGFVGDRAVSMSRSGQIRVFDIEGLKPTASFDGSPCRPDVTPDGTRIAFLVGPLVALLDPATRKITGTRWVGIPPPHPVLRFSPDGSTLAIGGNGRAILLNLSSGQFQTLNLPKMDVNDNAMFDKPFGWAGNSHLLADKYLFDPQLQQPAWEYSSAEQIQFRGGRVWAIARSPGSSTAQLKSFTMPDEDVLARSKTAKAKPDTFALQPGSGIKIDVTGVPTDRRTETQNVLEERLREVGFVPDPKAAAVLFASVDSPGTKPTVVYSGIGSYQYTKKMARLRLVLKDKELWNEAWAVEPPFAIEPTKGMVLADYLGKLAIGQPDYKAFALAPLPSYIPGSKAPTGPLGQTNLAPR